MRYGASAARPPLFFVRSNLLIPVSLRGRLCLLPEAISGYEETASLSLAVTLASKILRLQILPFWTNTFDQFNLFPSGISMGWFADTPPAPYARVPAQFCCLTGKYGCCVILNLPSQG